MTKISSKGIKQQVERILDESHEQTVSVIIQLGYPERFEESLRYAADEELQRDVVTRVTELLPSPIPQEKRGTAKRKIDGHTHQEELEHFSVRLPLARARRQYEQYDARIAAQGKPLKNALDSSVKPFAAIQSESLNLLARACACPSITASRLARRSDAACGRPKPLWLSRALSIEVDRDDLAGLSQALNATAVFPNRPIQLPPKWQTINRPPALERYATHTWGLEKTGALACWGVFGAQGKGVKVAVLDTGIDRLHPDLKMRLVDFAEFDRLGNKTSGGLDAALDDHGHGTHVCGIIAGGCASGCWIGMAPQAQLLVARVLSKTGGTDAQILAGMEWAVEQGADVINLSLGDLSFVPDVLDTYTAAIFNARTAGIPMIAAMGNDGNQTSGAPANDYFALAVGATNVDDQIAGFSAGRTQVITRSAVFDDRHLPFVYSKPELSAPGVDIFSASPAGAWKYLSGTSMAAPHVAGAMALLLGHASHPERLESDLRALQGAARVRTLNALLMGSVKPLGEAGQDQRFGWGRLDVLHAYSNAVKLGYLPAPACAPAIPPEMDSV